MMMTMKMIMITLECWVLFDENDNIDDITMKANDDKDNYTHKK